MFHRLTILPILVMSLFASVQAADFSQAQHWLDLGQYNKARKALNDEASKPGEQAQALAMQGEIHYRLGEFETGYQQLEQAITLAPENAYAQYWYGATAGQLAVNASIFSAFGYASDCEDGLTAAVKLQPNNLTYQKALFEFYLAAPEIAGGSLEKATETAAEIEKIAPQQDYQSKTMLLMASKQVEGLMHYISELESKRSDEAEVQHFIAVMHAQMGDLAKAQQILEKAILLPVQDTEQAKVVHSETVFALTQIQYELEKDLKLAKQRLLTLQKQNWQHKDIPNQNWVNFKVASIDQKLGNTASAKQTYQTVLQQAEHTQLKMLVEQQLATLD